MEESLINQKVGCHGNVVICPSGVLFICPLVIAVVVTAVVFYMFVLVLIPLF